jgi:hypothetical protein
MLGWWRRHRQARREIEAEAQALIERLGEDAREAATKEMVRTTRVGDYEANARWTRIRQLIDRETGHRGGPEAWTKAPPGIFGT